MAIKLITPATTEPVSLVEAKLHLRVDHSTEDTKISGLIKAARELAEDATWRAMITSTWELRLDAWPRMPLELPRAPLQSISSIKYVDEAGVEGTVASSVYDCDTASEPGRLFFKANQSWPGVTLYPFGGVRIQFVAGYANAAAVPEKVKAAILLIVGHLYENREQVIVASGLSPVDLPLGIHTLLASEKVWMS